MASNATHSDVRVAPRMHAAAVALIAAGVIVALTIGRHTRLFFGAMHRCRVYLMHRPPILAGDRLVAFLSDNPLVKGFPAVAALFYAWFQFDGTADGAKLSEKRQNLLYSLVILAPAVVLARVFAKIVPYRVRPIDNLDLHLRAAYTFDPHDLPHWSSFLSDHALFFFALAGVWRCSWRAGVFLYLHALIVIVLPRLYLGIHYPADILSGAVLGFAVGYSASWPALRSLIARPGMRLLQYSPGIFYAALFYIAAETAALYDHLLNAAVHAAQIIHSIAHHLKH